MINEIQGVNFLVQLQALNSLRTNLILHSHAMRLSEVQAPLGCPSPTVVVA